VNNGRSVSDASDDKRLEPVKDREPAENEVVRGLIIRALTKEDIEGPAGFDTLSSRLADEIKTERGGPLFLASRAPELQEIDESSHRMFRGAFVDGALVGWVVAIVRSLPNGELLGNIETLAVDPEAREIGIGEELLRVALSFCRLAGCIGVDSYALPGARETKNFFETFGMKARLLTVHVSFQPKVNVVSNDPVNDSVNATVVDSVNASVVDSVNASVVDSVNASVVDSVNASVVDSVDL
jgi:ribosomal protein S18 acetylase RimI-like enzyme